MSTTDQRIVEVKAHGLHILIYLDEFAATPVVQIDTPTDSDVHETLRVHLNDSTASEWRP